MSHLSEKSQMSEQCAMTAYSDSGALTSTSLSGGWGRIRRLASPPVLLKDLRRPGRPDKRVRFQVVFCDVAFDGRDQLSDVPECPSANPPHGQVAKEPLDGGSATTRWSE